MSDAAVATIVSGMITIVTLIIGFFTMLIKLKYAKEAVDANTELTKAGTEAAASNAKEAAVAASSVVLTTDSINKKLNGGLHSTINEAIQPELKTIQDKFDALASYVHQRNHDVLDGMQLLSTQMTLLARKLEEKEKQQT